MSGTGSRNGARHPRLPLVYASPRAVEQAQRLLPSGVVIENLVTRGIADGAVSYRRARGIALVHGTGWTAVVHRCLSRLGTGRKGWQVIEIHAGVSERAGESRPGARSN